MAEAELKTLGRYTIERTLGKGAMGVVYEGLDPKLNRRVAIKTILKSHLDPDTAKDYSMRFSREAQAVARLNHPHIVQVYDFAEEGDIAYLVMEFIRGKELKHFFDAAERFDLKEAVRIMSELLDALEFAHNAGIIHRDIKPANVMLDAQARTKLTDFGVARVQDVDRTHAERTQAGTMVGTPAYMSPEQITGGNIDKRSDVFSAGIILYQFLTGEKPFTGGGAWTIAKKIIQEDPPLPSSLNNAVTRYFDAVVNKALSKNPDTRYQSAKDFGVALRRALEGKGDEEDADRTVVGDLTLPPSARQMPPPRPQAAVSGSGTQTGSQAGNQEVELEFWRAIKDGNDPDDFELYVQQFPTGIYAALAKRKIAKLRGAAEDETSAEAKQQAKKDAEEAARREAAARSKLAEEKEKLELELAKKEEEYQRREAEREAQEKARREAIEKEKQEAAAERERARAEAEQAKQEAERARLEAIEKAKQEAAAERERARLEAEKARKEAAAEAEKARLEAIEKAKQEAEKAKQEAEKLRREAELKAKQEAAAAAEKAKKELEAERERARLETEKAKKEAEKARREAEEKAKKETEALAKKQAEERAKREAEFKKREAELKAQAAAGGKKTSPAVLVGVPAVIIAIAGAGWYFLAPDDAAQQARIAAMQKQLEEAKKQAEQAEKAKKAAEDARVALEKARRDAEEAKRSGDAAKQKAAAEAAARAEAEAKKTADAKARADADAKKTADAARVAQDKASKEERARAEKLAAENRAAAEKAAAEKARAEKLAAERAAQEKAAAEKAIADAKAAAERAKAEAERQIAEARAAAEKARAEAEKAKVAAAATATAAPPGGEALFDQAEALERDGKGRDAVKVYVRAARAGNGKAAKRLGDIYDKGIAGVSRDYAESLKWYNAARVLGEDVPTARSR
jgi:serine/threonine protein kinase